MRRVLTVSAVAALVLGVTTATAYAAVTSPTNGTTVSGTITVSDSPGGTDTQSLKICGGNTHTTLSVVSVATGATITSQTKQGSYSLLGGGDVNAGPISYSFSTETVPNGSYKIVSVEQNGVGSGFLNLGCSSGTASTFTNTITIDNQSKVTYTGDTSDVAGTTGTVSASVVDPVTGSALVGANVTFALSGGASVTTPTNSLGVASATIPVTLPARVATMSVSVAASTFYDGSSTTTAFAVTRAASSISVAQPAAVVFGQATQFTATVGFIPGFNPGGGVQFLVDGTNFGSVVTLGSSATVSSISTSSLSTGPHTVTAVYLGDPNYLTSTSAGVTQTVNPAATTTTLQSSLNPAVYGQPVTFTATVAVLSPGVATPTGGVQFTIDGNPFGTAVPLTGLTATLTIPVLGGGNHSVVATYNGDGNTALSNSATLTQSVDRSQTAIAIQSTSQPSVTGQGVNFTATVTAQSPGMGTPTGTVQFNVDGNPFGSPVTLANGVASSPTISNLTVGQHVVIVDYSGDSNFSGVESHTLQNVNQDSTSTTISSTPNPSVFGQGVTFSTTVSANTPGSGTPTGQVQFAVDGVSVGTPVTLDSSGNATSAVVSNLSVGDHEITVSYLGDAGYSGSTSAQLDQTVNKAATTTSLISNANPSVFGQPVTFTAAVSVTAPGAGDPTGTLVFSEGANVLDTETVSSATGEQASFTTAALGVGPHVITVSYSGDGSFLSSTTALTQTVHRAQTSILLTSSANPSVSGQAVKFTATVTPVAPGAGVPTGPVQFSVNGAPIGSPVSLTGGVATSAAFASLTPGTYNITAAYAGDGNFVGSNGVLDEGNGQSVSQAGTSMVLTSSNNPANFGTTVAFTATVTGATGSSGTPTGVVDFYDGANLIGAVSLSSVSAGVGAATFSTSSLLTGPHAISATYLGNFNFASASGALSQVIGTVTSVTGLTVTPNPATYGGTVTLTSVVNTDPSGEGTPTGSVTFLDGSAVLGTVPLSTVGGQQQASLTVSTFTAGVHPITAEYSGSSVLNPSTSVVVNESVGRAASNLVAARLITYSNAQGVEVSQVNATLTGLGGAPLAGQTIVFTTLSFGVYATPVCTAVTDSTGNAECAVTLNSADDNYPTIISNGGYDANFDGNTNYLPSHGHGVA